MTEELLATYQILSLFERSKSMSDQILDNLSGVFVAIDGNGRVLRANKVLAGLLNVPYEDALNEDLSSLFSARTWNVFQTHLKDVAESGSFSKEFELPIDSGRGANRSYVWQIGPMPAGERNSPSVGFICIGKDITDVVQAMKKIVALDKDLELTKAMQDLLLPETDELSSGKVDIVAAYRPAATTAGDFWWIKNINEDLIWIIIADVTGHGAGPAMVTSTVSGCLETLWANKAHGKLNLDLPSLLGSINHCLYRLRGQPYWMTAAAIEFDLKSEMVRWWGAASPPILVRSAKGALECYAGMASPLGMRAKADLTSGHFKFERGDRVLLLTDGLLECSNSKSVQFGLRRVQKILADSASRSPKELKEEFLRSMDAWLAGADPDDDTTFVIVDRKV